MLKNIAIKAFNLYTAPARYVLGQTADHFDKVSKFKAELLLVGDDVKAAQREMAVMAEEVYYKVATDLSQLPAEITPKEVESTALQAMLNAKRLIADATVELAKGAILLSSIPLQVRMSESENTNYNIIEGEIEK